MTPLGRRASGDIRPRRPGSRTFVREVFPEFRRLANDRALRATVLLAWARAAKGDQSDPLIGTARGWLADRRDRGLLLLALGSTRNEAAFDPIIDSLHESKRDRAFAALAAGVLGDTDAIEDLLTTLRERDLDEDLLACTVRSLGILAGRADPAARRAVDKLLRKELRLRRWPRAALEAIPGAIGMIGGIDKLHATLADTSAPNGLRAACALALGVHAPALTAPIVDLLTSCALEDANPAVRCYSSISLGEIANRHTADDAQVERVRAFFGKALDSRAKGKLVRPWHCLSAALFARRFAVDADSIADRLLRIARRGRAQDERAAAVVGLGILGNRRVIHALAKLAAREKNDVVSAYLAETRGMLRDRTARKELLELCTSDASERVRYHAALGLGSLADSGVIRRLTAAFDATRSRAVQGALARALGRIGDRAAIAPLLAIAMDASRDRQTRRHALVALGMIGERSDRTWVDDLRRGFPPASQTATMRTVLMLP